MRTRSASTQLRLARTEATVQRERRDLHVTAIEFRQDLIGDEAGQQKWSALLARLLPLAYQAV